MGRPAKPWPRKGRGWYATIGGCQRKVADEGATKAEAERNWHALMAAEGRAPAGSLPVLALGNLYLDAVALTIEPETFDSYLKFLSSFSERWGSLAAAEVRPLHVSRWFEGHPTWGASTRSIAGNTVKRMLRWAKGQGHLESNPLADLKLPGVARRETIPTPGEAVRLVDAAASREFTDFAKCLYLTGCRPKEVATLEADRVLVAEGKWLVLDKIRRKTGRRYRAVFPGDEAMGIAARLAAARPEGPIFLNSKGTPWNQQTWSKHFRRLRRRLGLGGESVAYALRHLYVTDALEKGVPVATVAALVGHTDIATTIRVYSKLADRHDHLRDAAKMVRGPGAGPGPGSGPASA